MDVELDVLRENFDDFDYDGILVIPDVKDVMAKSYTVYYYSDKQPTLDIESLIRERVREGVKDYKIAALELDLPLTIRNKCRKPTGFGFPEHNTVTYTFPGTPHTTSTMTTRVAATKAYEEAGIKDPALDRAITATGDGRPAELDRRLASADAPVL